MNMWIADAVSELLYGASYAHQPTVQITRDLYKLKKYFADSGIDVGKVLEAYEG
jgi:hypothetical protein